MSFSIGCFALNTPFRPLTAQLEQIRTWGFRYADVTDNSDGACLGVEFGFTGLASLDAHPQDIRRLFAEQGITITAWCAHASLLDPAAPWRYGTMQILKAVRMASALGIPHVITTEGEPHTAFGRSLTPDEQLFAVREKLCEPLRVAEECGVKILLEPHGPLSCSIEQTERLLEASKAPALALNLDTGNLWLGGGDPLDYIRRFGSLIEHVHWKDLPASMESVRGTRFGCGMSDIPLGTGAVNIGGVVRELRRCGFSGHTTLEVAGGEAVLESARFLSQAQSAGSDRET